MTHEPFAAVEQYLTELYVPRPDALSAALAANHAAGLPGIDITPTQGKFLQLLVRLQGARQILEIGTLGGYSALWLAGGLPAEGRLVTLEVNAHHADVARGNFTRAGLADRIELRLGPALESLAGLEAEGRGPFDFIFIDADKMSYPQYVTSAIRLARRGSLIVVDNVVREGEIIDAGSRDPGNQATRRMHSLLASDPRVSTTVLQTTGSKGYDGFALALVVADP